MSTLKLGVSGASGRMGQSILDLAQSIQKVEVTESLNQKSSLSSWEKEKVDVVIDFSSPQALKEVLNWCLENKKPLVSGTTSLDEGLKNSMKKASKVIPIVWSANMSLGIAWLNQCLKNIPDSIKEWDVQVQETHHNLKKDSPSGTALMLHETLKAIGAQPNQPLSIRGGGVHGIHKVHFMGLEEICSLEHITQDRKVFARGAIKAALWVAQQKKPDLYTINHCL